MATIRPQVLAQLKRAPKSLEQLHAAIDEIENEKQLANCLYNLRKAGEVRKCDDGRYELGKEKNGSTTRDPIKAAAAKYLVDHKNAERFNAAQPANPLRQMAPEIREQRDMLEKAALETQDALDAYLASVADPKILKPLRAARDATRAAVKAFDAIEALRA